MIRRPNGNGATAAILALALVMTGCTTGAQKNTSTAIIASGETMLAVSNSFNDTATRTYFPYCLPAAKKGFEKFCPAFKDFAKRFDQVYQPAVRSWFAAVQANDTAAALGAEAAVLQLTTELAAMTAAILIEQQGGKP
jgi:hypothetical protein